MLTFLNNIPRYVGVRRISLSRRQKQARRDIARSGLFDKHFYLENNPDVRVKQLDPLAHYVLWGECEGRWPCSWFDPNQYAAENPDVVAAKTGLFQHYIKYGKREGRWLGRTAAPNIPSGAAPQSWMQLAAVIAGQSRATERLSTVTDILVPIYNNLDLLQALLKDIEQKTASPYRLILVDDASPDRAVNEFLHRYAENHDKVVHLRNAANVGFVGACNAGFALAENHVALLNTDIRLPRGWLERLMAPIEKSTDIATTTPFTNAGTLCSFPNIPEDNRPFLNLDVDATDAGFARLTATALSVPTGVGFCMGIRRELLDGEFTFDEEQFGRGYCEENDFCQKAAAKGFRNVHVTNLYVEHLHGASFGSEEKRELIASNLRALDRRWPEYHREVASYLTADPAKIFRETARLLLLTRPAHRPALLIDHDLGGGTTAYRQRRIAGLKASGRSHVLVICDSKLDRYRITCEFDDEQQDFTCSSFTQLLSMLRVLGIAEIMINSLVDYSAPLELLDGLSSFVEHNGIKLSVLFHDFYPICPSIVLLQGGGRHCGLPSVKECEACNASNPFSRFPQLSMGSWRKSWERLLAAASDIEVFSNNSRDYVTRTYPAVTNKVQLRPHSMDYFKPQSLPLYENKLAIGVLGGINVPKGRRVVYKLARELRKRKSPIKIFVIGKMDRMIRNHPNLVVLGEYLPENLASIVEKHRLDSFLMPSVWPETFSYVTEELMALQRQIICFDIGAQGEKIMDYPRGDVLPIECAGDGAALYSKILAAL